MTSCPEAMGREFGDFEKDASLELTVDQSSWELTSGYVSQTFCLCHLGHRDMSSLPWSRELES